MGNNLLAILGVGRGTWGHVSRLIQEEPWDNIVLFGDEFGEDNFELRQENIKWVMVNKRKSFDTMKEIITEHLIKKNVVVSIISGTGKEHTALLGALKEAGIKYKLIILAADGTQYI